MNSLEKESWYTLAITLFAVSVWGGFVLAGKVEAAPIAFVSVALIALFPLARRRARREGKVIVDERDNAINQKATAAAHGIFWVLFVTVCMMPFFLKGPNATITVRTTRFCDLVFLGMTVVYLVRSAVVIILYKRGCDAGEA